MSTPRVLTALVAAFWRRRGRWRLRRCGLLVRRHGERRRTAAGFRWLLNWRLSWQAAAVGRLPICFVGRFRVAHVLLVLVDLARGFQIAVLGVEPS